jgi:hypothetical protein
LSAIRSLLDAKASVNQQARFCVSRSIVVFDVQDQGGVLHAGVFWFEF